MSFIYNKKKSKKYNIHISTFIFNSPLNTIWKIINDPTLLQLFNKVHNSFDLLKEHSQKLKLSYEIGIGIKNFFEISSEFLYKIHYMIESDYYCEIIWICSLINNKFNLPPIKSIFRLLNNNDKTIFISEYYFHKSYDAKFFIKDEKKRQKYYNSIQKSILNKKYLKNFNFSININGNFYKAYNLFYNIKLMTSLYSDIIKCNSNLFEKNNELIVKIKNKKFDCNKEVIVKYKVGNLIINKILSKIFFELFMNSKNSKAKIILSLEKKNNESFTLEINFNFIQILNENENYFWKLITRNFLLKIIQIFEKI